MRRNSWLVMMVGAIAFISGCASIDEQQLLAKQESYHVGFQPQTVLADKLKPKHDIGDADTGFYPLSRGHDALLTRLAIIESAEVSLDVQYYIFRSDETGQMMTWRLFEAAERGVKVRVLLDDMQKRNDQHLGQFNAHPNIEVRLFNPHQFRSARLTSMATDFERLNRRMHNKSITADTVASIVGGRNIGNEYFSIASNVEFGDFDMLLYGKAVEETSEQFDVYWNSIYAVPMELIVKGAHPATSREMQDFAEDTGLLAKFTEGEYDITKLPLYQDFVTNNFELFWGEADVLYDFPQKVADSSSELVIHLRGMLNSTENELVIISPYFVPTDQGTQQLIAAVEAGKKITIITNSLASNDVFAVHGWYAKYRQALVEGGIELWEVKDNADLDNHWSFAGSGASSLHAKVILFDKRKIFVGSMNFDPRSVELNTEMGVLIKHPEFVTETIAVINRSLPEVAYKLDVVEGDLIWLDEVNSATFHSEPNASWMLRFSSWFAGILPIEHQL